MDYQTNYVRNNDIWGERHSSIYDVEFTPQISKLIGQKYGNAFGVNDWINMVGSRIPIMGNTLKFFELGSLENPITLGTGGIAANAVGAVITFKCGAADYDVNNTGGAIIGQHVLIPRAYMLDKTRDGQYRVSSKDAGVGVNRIYTAIPVDDDFQVALPLVAGTELKMSGDSYALNTGQPEGKTFGHYNRSFITDLTKTTFKMEGSDQYRESYLDNLPLKGGTGTGHYYMATLQWEFEHNKKLNDKIWNGVQADNAALVQTDADGNSRLVKSQRGLQEWMRLLAQKKTYADKFDIADFDDIKPLLMSQGLVAQDILFGMGDLLYANMENSSYNFIKEFSSNTDIMGKMNSVGLQFKAINKLGSNFIFKEISDFGNPNGLGGAAYNDVYRKMGFMIPMNDNPVTVLGGGVNGSGIGSEIKLKTIQVGYPSNKGENRSRVIGYIKGMTGNDNIPGQITSEYDQDKGYILSEEMYIFTGINKTVLVNAE